jgi:hypothetical protein
MWEVVLAIRHHGCPVSDTSARYPEVHLQNLSKGQLPDGKAKRLLGLRGPSEDIEAFTEEFRAHPRGVRFERISESGSGLTYYTSEIAYRSNNPSILELMYVNGCYQHSSVSIRDGIETWKLYTEDKSVVHNLIADIESRGNEVSLYRSKNLGEISDATSMEFDSLATRLTARQQKVFETALKLGYYEADSDVTTETIGEELELHQSTVWEHLSKAENALLTEIGSQMFSVEDRVSV